jgi:signal transduction histidine kinase
LVLLRQGNRENRTFVFFTALLGLWLLSQFIAQLLYRIAPALAETSFRLTLMLPAFFVVDFYNFTRRYTSKLRQVNMGSPLHYIAPLLLAASALVPGLLYHSATLNYVGITVEGTPLYTLLIVFVGTYIILGVWNLLVYLKHDTFNRESVYRTRFLLFGIGTAATIIFVAVVFFSDALLSQLAAPIALLAMVSLFGYAIVKHRLFDIRLIVVRLLAYLLSLLVVAGLYALLAFGLFARLLNMDNLTYGQEFAFVVVAMVLAVTFAPLKRFFDRVTRAVFYQDAYDTQQVLDDIGAVLVSKVDVKRLVHESLTILKRALKSDYIVIMLIDPESGGVGRTISVGRPSQLSEAYSVIVRRAAPLLVTDGLDGQDDATYRVLQKSNVSVAVNLETSKDLMGYIIYGTKVSGRIYSNDDLKLVRIATDELAVAVQNALRFEEITKFNETLQKEVRDATSELRESNKKLKSLDEAKDEFISMASHQLRTPLTSVKGYISMVLEEDAGKLNLTQHQLLDQAFASSQRMVYLISDFLNVSRLQTGKFTIERTPVVLSGVVQQEVKQLESTAEARNIKLECNVPSSFPVLQLDEAKIRQATMNFVDNAIFYSRPGGVIRVDLVKTAKELVLTVQDQGIGVPASEWHHLFTKFYRASNARVTRPDGTGIGLFMAKKVVVAHGGSIIFSSVENKGSTFGFRLPLKQSSVLSEDHPEELK